MKQSYKDFDDFLEFCIKNPNLICRSAKRVAARRGVDVEWVYKAKEIIKRTHPGLIYRTNNPSAYNRHSSHVQVLPDVPTTPEVVLPKVLIFDIETAPMLAYVWKRWKENISLDQTVNDWFMLCWSAKWLYGTTTMSDALTPQEALNQDDKRICQSLWDLIDAADIVIAYNGAKFDVPRINTRFLIHGFNPPSSYINFDPMKTVKYKFGFSSNKLDNLARQLGFDLKLETTFELWKGCMEGDAESLEYMEKYNRRDVTLLEEVYLRLLPWLSNHPNIANMTGSDCCPFCGHPHDESSMSEALYYTGVNAYPTYRCPHCGGNYRGRKSISKPSSLSHNAH